MKSIRRNRGFTLIEILIVVIILGILAAIVIPQFSNASTSAKTSAVLSTAQSLRQQVALYKLQHNDKLPDGTSSANFWKALTTQTDSTGGSYTAGTSPDGPFGPYMQSIPANSLNQSSVVFDSAQTYPGAVTTACGWVYDYTGGTGRVWGTGQDSKTLVGP